MGLISRIHNIVRIIYSYDLKYQYKLLPTPAQTATTRSQIARPGQRRSRRARRGL